ncbi:MAG: heavy-metal-associated domain-containing protein [Sediminibacterium sp.]
MKKIFLIVACICVISASAQVQKVNLQASGLTCAMCSKAIYKAVSAISFVDTVFVNIEASTYDIRFNKESTPHFDQIAKAVVDAGFSVANLTVMANFDKQVIDKNGLFTLDGIQYKLMGAVPATLQGSKKLQLIGKQYMLPKDFKKIPASSNTGMPADTYLVSLK